MDSVDNEVISLNKICRMVEEGNQSDINIIKINYEKIKQIRGKIVIKESRAKIEYLELLKKLACYEKEQLLNYKKALVLQKEILELKKIIYPEDDITIADTIVNIGLAYFDMGQSKNAIKQYEQALKIKFKSLPNNDPAIAEIFNHLGNAYFHLNNLTKSMQLLKKAMDIYEGLSEDCLGYANTLHNYGEVQYRLGYKNKAKEFYEKALEMKRKTLPENHSSIAETLDNLGLVCNDLDDKNKAKEFYERALGMYRETIDQNHILIARILKNLGNVYSDLGDKKFLSPKSEYIFIKNKAKEFLEEALEMYKKTLPVNDKSIADILHNLGSVYYNLDDKNKAKELYEKALEIKSKTLPDDHSSIADTLNSIGVVYSDLRDYNKAKEFFERALEVYRKTLPENHPSIQRTLNNLNIFTSCLII